MISARQTAKTLVVGVILMVITGFAPAFVLTAVGWSNGVDVAILTGLALFVACIGGHGWRTGLIVAAPFAVLAALAVWAAPNPWWSALVLAAAAFLRGYAARVGMHNALIMVVISLGFLVASPPRSDNSMPAPLFVGLIALAVGLWVTLVIYVLRKRLTAHQHTHLEPIRVLAFSLALAFLVGVATWFVVDLHLGHTGAWIILTIVVVFQPSLGAGFRKAAHRAAGTFVGFVIAIAVGALVPSGPWLYVVGTIFLMAAFVFMLQGRAYWLFAAALTTAIVLLESAGSPVYVVAERRLEATLIGVTVTFVMMLALAPLAKRLTTKDALSAT